MQKICQTCNKEFEIEKEELVFYEKIQVPIPRFCPDCRLRERMVFRNERTLYKRKTDVPGRDEEIISIFSPDSDQIAYDAKTWWGDSWEGTNYAESIDWDKPFFEQLKNLWRKVPDMALANINGVNSDYCSITEGNKNCYLVVGGDFNENVMYSSFTFNTKDSIDLHWVSKSDLCYETLDSISCSRLLYSRQCDSCIDSAFLFNCKNCSNCFGCVNLRNAQHCFFNEQLDKKTYEEKIKNFDLSSYETVQKIKKQFEENILKHPHKFARIIKSVNSTGDNLEGTNNCKNSFDVFGGAKNCKNIWLAYSNVQDCYDCDHFGKNSENSYQNSTIYPGSNVFFSRFILESHDVCYSYNCHNCSNVFGCVGLRNKHYCILNKQYTKEEYQKVKEKIIKQLKTSDMYGEFFPPHLSPFGYNETLAQEYIPLTEKEAREKGFNWQTEMSGTYGKETIKQENIPEAIDKATEDPRQGGVNILKEILVCKDCKKNFRITKSELDFYKRMNIPLPHKDFECRHQDRMKKRNPRKLWHRSCMCELENHQHGTNKCEVEFETSYSPDRPEIVYCEKCYQQEVY